MNAIDPDAAREHSKPLSDADAAVEQSMGRLLRPHVGSFAAVVVLQVIGAVAGLAPLPAAVELGRTLLKPGPVDHGHVWDVVILGAVGLFVRLVFTAASSGIEHILDGRVQLTFRRRLAARLGRGPIGRLSRRRTGELVSAFVVPLMMTPKRLREQEEFDAAMGRISASVVEFVQGISVVKAFGGSGRTHRKSGTASDEQQRRPGHDRHGGPRARLSLKPCLSRVGVRDLRPVA
ncbi:hypothetical protein [Streptomyces sp. NPDC051677]|uniref:hypothetical protein n=1 Tax=Streptomyces sp. NPDC051677 TaxID=3365669 RepID=UPI0037D7D839